MITETLIAPNAQAAANFAQAAARLPVAFAIADALYNIVEAPTLDQIFAHQEAVEKIRDVLIPFDGTGVTENDRFLFMCKAGAIL